ncbi:MAG: oligosaccharide flippase family protein [Pseudomonadota bacterium]
MQQPSESSIGRQVRGSGMLFAGRILAKFVNLGVQVAVVRLLTLEDFGAFAYGLALVLAGELLVKLGLGRGAGRFIPHYYEHGEYDRLLGTLVLVCGTIMVLGTLGLGLTWLAYREAWAGFPSGDGGLVVLTLAVLAPVQALDGVCIQILATVAGPKQILFRRYFLGPLLKLTAVIVVFILGGDVMMLALAYLSAGLIGLWICLSVTIGALKKSGVLPRRGDSAFPRIPFKPLLSFSLPMISSDLVFVTQTAITSVVLMRIAGETEVAIIRAVVPMALLNTMVLQSFQMLFMPYATRAYARGDLDALRNHHWQCVAWVTVASFPLFVTCCALAPIVVPLILGSDYLPSALLLAILSLGHYAIVCLGFNADTLQLLGRTKAIVITDVTIIAVATAAAIWLCPAHGALGAACAVTMGRIVGALVRQRLLTRRQVLGPPPAMLWRIWAGAGLAVGVSVWIGWAWAPNAVLQFALIGAVSLLLLRATGSALALTSTFPALARVPLLTRIVGS